MNKVRLMAVVNMTPDSLYASSLNNKDVESQIRRLVEEGADIIDIGGESTGPGSEDVSAAEEWRRIEPALNIASTLKKNWPIEVSVDTYKADVFEKALKYGVDMLNDISGLRGDSIMADLLAKSGKKVCIMYARITLRASGNNIRTNNDAVEYDDVIATIAHFWHEQINYALEHGIKKNQIILDPGMGAFVSGNPKYSYEIIARLDELKAQFSNFPILVGASRKGFLGQKKPGSAKLAVEDRLPASLEAAKLAVENGADILRVHDIAQTKHMF